MNKITKLLSVFIIAGAIGTGIAGVAGCKGGGDDSGNGGGGETCQHTTVRYEDNHDGATHKVICTDECKETVNASQAHVDDNGSCTLCGGDVDADITTISVANASIKTGQSITLEATVSPAGTQLDITWSIVQGDQYATLEGKVLTAGNTPGTVMVKASAEGVEDATATITIKPASQYDYLLTKDNVLVKDTDYEVGTKFEEDTVPGSIYLKCDSGAKTRGEYIEVQEEAGAKVFKQVNPGVKNTNKNIATVIDFGHVTNVEGYFETKITKIASGGEQFIKFMDGDTAALTIIAKGSELSYKVGSGAETKITGATFDVNIYVSVYYKFDLATGKTSLEVAGVSVLDEQDTGIKSVSNVTLSTGNSGERVQTTKSIVAAGDLMAVSAYAEQVSAKLVAYKTAATVDDVLMLSADAVDTALSTATAAITAADSFANVDAKYAEGVEAVDAAIVAQAKTSAKTLLGTYRNDETFAEDEATKLAGYKTAGETAIDAETVTTVQAVKDALAAAKAQCDTCLSATDVSVNVTIKDAEGNDLTTTPWSKKDGDKITKAELDALFTVESGKKVSGYYKTNTEGTLSEEVDFGEDGYTLVAENGETTALVLYAKIENQTTVTKVLSADELGAKGRELIAADATGTQAITKWDTTNETAGEDTGFLACNDGSKVVKVDTQNKLQVINLAGSVSVNNGVAKNAIAIECGPGSITVTVKYFSGNKDTHAGRYACVMDASGKSLANSNDKPTTADQEVKEGVMTFTLDEAGTIYIGAASSGLYVTEISVTYTA